MIKSKFLGMIFTLSSAAIGYCNSFLTHQASDFITRSYGSGYFCPTDDLGETCFRLKSTGFYAGGELQLKSPLLLKDVFSEKNPLFSIEFIQGGEGLFLQGEKTKRVACRRPFELKIVWIYENGQPDESLLSIQAGTKEIAFPTRSLKGFSLNKKLEKIRFETKSSEILYFTKFYFTNDSTPIKGKILKHPTEVGLGEMVQFKAKATSGKLPCVFQWCVDPLKMLQTDGKGETWSYVFSEPGEHLVRLVISDPYGFKRPCIIIKKIKVNP